MTEQTQAERLVSGHRQPGPSCPTCKTPSRYLTSMLDVRRDRTILIYRCDDCREEIWQ